jgi:hypothetical protein
MADVIIKPDNLVIPISKWFVPSVKKVKKLKKEGKNNG